MGETMTSASFLLPLAPLLCPQPFCQALPPWRLVFLFGHLTTQWSLHSPPVMEVLQKHRSSELLSFPGFREDELNLNYTQKRLFSFAEGEDVTSQAKRNPTGDAPIPREDHSN